MPTRLERLVAIKHELDRGRYPDVQTLCDKFEIKERTLHEDLRLMREQMGMEIKFDRFKNGYYNASPEKTLPTFDLTVGEVFALTMAKDLLVQYTGTPFEPILQDALEKIQKRLPEKVQVNMDDVAAAVEFGHMPAPQFSRKMFMDLHTACETHHQVQLDYLSAYKNEYTTRVVNPHKLLAHQNSWYLVAYCNLRNDLRLFALHRIKNYEPKEETFVPVDLEKLDGWLKSPLFIEHRDTEAKVAIRFNSNATTYVKERNWHPSQTIVDHEDGSCTLSFNATSMDEVKRWVLTYGADAEVLEPETLRKEMEREAITMLERYRRTADTN